MVLLTRIKYNGNYGKEYCPSFNDEYADSRRVYCITTPELFQYLIPSTLDNIVL